MFKNGRYPSLTESPGPTLEISTARSIAAAEIWSGNRPAPGCVDGCCTFGSTIVIDNVTFDGGEVPTAPTSWGSIKALYR